MDQVKEKTQPKGNRIKVLGRLLKLVLTTSPWMLVVSIITIILAAASAVIGSLFIERLIDTYVTPLLHEKVPNYGPLFNAILVMFGIYAIGFLSNYLFSMLMGVLAQKVQFRVRNETFTHMESLPIAYFDQNNYGDIMSRYTNDIDTLMQMISQSLPQFLNSALSLIFVIVAMFSLSWQLTLFSFIIFALSFGIVRFLTVRSSHYFKVQQNKLGQINGYDEEMLNGLKVIKVFSHEPEAEEGFDKFNEELRGASGKANTYATILFPIMGNMGNLLYVLIAFIGGAAAINGWAPLTLGAIASFLQLSRQFSMPIAQISQQLNSIVLALAGAQRIFELEDEPSEVDNGDVIMSPNKEVKNSWYWDVPEKNGDIKKVPIKGHIVFDHVNFSYVPEHQILYDINIDAKPGMKVALVGETGAGKTTISNMLNRFYEIQSGKITYDGVPISQIRKNDLRHSLSIVLQETHLFTGTIMDNIRFGKPDASDDEVYQAARLAHADEFIHELDDGYETVIDGDGGDLSQGQMQLLSIARAMIADEPVMILDEATSSIDTRTERMVQAGMDNLLAGRTSFVIAHRLSTIVNSDLILVLDHGHIIERGTHEELLKQKGYYYELYTGKKELD
ncbi:ABC transporter ATP-binding protein [Lactobacillus johnsonii]|jgi:ATP-binding cassette subfamily B multidrug efflux pump|uniref:ABC transporter ATP-binding protein n=1 Tax=Lactobacillus johnsonii TaxID=33959 RepID=A0A9W4EB41_LACJH|nr:ABC transporter ATP-binding protein [Lactobacillus johnsonii]AZZ68204.1 ABC transporter ATP-binding protein [Lactobacillus johnsonii]MCI6763109.1 ABC transporter ATP-binding protein/permease [Lactobacillus johnsonii]MCI7647513.1 ABC transporter ATP-binding protein/permease [Lactobacillus johnsonii]MCI7715034.1 ABC transporter ATP-binding protein/permease [Lactobacillus johnsonii]MDY5352297.1 ABC transporter ATP-binding protein [Lactobacillus johnsonii]